MLQQPAGDPAILAHHEVRGRQHTLGASVSQSAARLPIGVATK